MNDIHFLTLKGPSLYKSGWYSFRDNLKQSRLTECIQTVINIKKIPHMWIACLQKQFAVQKSIECQGHFFNIETRQYRFHVQVKLSTALLYPLVHINYRASNILESIYIFGLWFWYRRRQWNMSHATCGTLFTALLFTRNKRLLSFSDSWRPFSCALPLKVMQLNIIYIFLGFLALNSYFWSLDKIGKRMKTEMKHLLVLIRPR